MTLRHVGGKMAILAIADQQAERRFYFRMALFMIALVFVGFSPSFYLRGLVMVPRPNPVLSPLVMLHGLMFSAWILLFLIQTSLVSAGRRDLHMKLGIVGMIFAVTLLPLMYMTTVGQVVRANQPPFATPLGWTGVPLAVILPFAILVGLAWKNRYQPQAHKRLMLCAGLLIMQPAIGRYPILPPFIASFCVLTLLSWLTIVPLFIWDRRTIGRLHWATKLGAVLSAIAYSLGVLGIATPGWERVAALLPGV